MKLNSALRSALLLTLFFTLFFPEQCFAQYIAQPSARAEKRKSHAAPTVLDEAPAVYEWHDKLKRGTINIFSAIVEIPKHIHERTEKETLIAGWTIGVFEGAGFMLLRFASGVVDVVTCPFDFPKEGKVPLIDPEYVWQKSKIRYA